MPFSSASKPRPQLVRAWGLGLLTLPVATLLVLLAPRQSVLELQPGEQPDSVSLAYAELLLRAHPSDHELRLRLIEQLIALGKPEQARRHIAKIDGNDYKGELGALRLEIDLQEMLAAPEQRQAAMPLLREHLKQLMDSPLSDRRLERLAQIALMLEAPLLAARAYEHLANQAPEQRLHWLEESARNYRAAGKELAAARIYRQLTPLATSTEDKDRLRQAAFDSLVAANWGSAALAWLVGQLDSLSDSPDNLALLAKGVQVARWLSERDYAERILSRWQALAPNDPDSTRTAFELALSFGEIEKAWQLAAQLFADAPDDLDLLRQIAQLGQWVGDNALAMHYWSVLATRTQREEDYRQAWLLAIAAFDFEQVNTLLSTFAEQHELDDPTVVTFMQSFADLARPEEGAAWLQEQLAHTPQRRLLWEQLLVLLHSMQHLDEEAATWAAMARHHRLTEQERIRWAELQWSRFAPQEAWAALGEHGKGSAWWRLRGMLAWALERDDDVVLALEYLRQNGENLSESETAQLVQIYQLDQPRKALEIVMAAWERRPRYVYIHQALQLAMRLEDWKQLEYILKEGQKMPDQLQQDPQGWLARLALSKHRGRWQETDRLLRQMMSYFPHAPWAMEQYLWARIDNGEPGDLQQRLHQWRSIARDDSSLWLPFASASSLIGDLQQALYWYGRYVSAHPHDWLVQAAYADTLELSGRADSAWRLRRHLLQQWPKDERQPTPDMLSTYLRLLSGQIGAGRARAHAEQFVRGAPQHKPALQAWFERQLDLLDATNQSALTDDWLAWARQQGLRIDQAVAIQASLRQWQREQMQQWLMRPGLPVETRVALLQQLGFEQEALRDSLQAIGDRQSDSTNQQLRAVAQAALDEHSRGIQFALQQIDHGTWKQTGPQVRMAGLIGESRIELVLGDSRFTGQALTSTEENRSLHPSAIGNQQDMRLTARRPVSDGYWEGTIDLGHNDIGYRHGLAGSRYWELGHGDALALGFEWHVQSTESGLMRALGTRDSVSISGNHALTSRDQFNWTLAGQHFNTLDGDSLGKGYLLSAQWNHRVLATHPLWLLHGGVTWQHAGIGTNEVQIDHLPALQANQLMSPSYGELSFGSSWQRGIPGALNRIWPGMTWSLDVQTGWQWTQSRPTYAIETGVGAELLGDDELAVLASYNSAPRSGAGAAGGLLRLVYSLRFGR